MVAQRLHRHARLRWDSGNDAWTEALIDKSAHQQGVSKDAERAGAHSFGPSHKGHTKLGCGLTIGWAMLAVFESSKLRLNRHVAHMKKPPPMAVRVDKTVRIHKA